MEDLRQLEEKAEELEEEIRGRDVEIARLKGKISRLERDLRRANGNVRAFSAVIGLMAEKYPENLASQYIRECVSLGLAGDLMKKETSALRYLSQIMSGETYERMVALCAEETVEDPEPEFEMPDVSAKRDPAEAKRAAAGASSGTEANGAAAGASSGTETKGAAAEQASEAEAKGAAAEAVSGPKAKKSTGKASSGKTTAKTAAGKTAKKGTGAADAK